MAHNHGWAHDENFVIVYLDGDKYTMVPCRNDEENVFNLLQIGKKRKLKNLYKVDYKGKVTPFKELNLKSEKLRKLIKELTGK
jgi:hypothetical protein